jgi:hypothetical protein
MRDRTQKELAATNESAWLSDLFLFTDLADISKHEPRQLFLDPVWYTPTEDDNLLSLLGE